jgi:hypothetical protein
LVWRSSDVGRFFFWVNSAAF